MLPFLSKRPDHYLLPEMIMITALGQSRMPALYMAKYYYSPHSTYEDLRHLGVNHFVKVLTQEDPLHLHLPAHPSSLDLNFSSCSVSSFPSFSLVRNKWFLFKDTHLPFQILHTHVHMRSRQNNMPNKRGKEGSTRKLYIQLLCIPSFKMRTTIFNLPWKCLWSFPSYKSPSYKHNMYSEWPNPWLTRPFLQKYHHVSLPPDFWAVVMFTHMSRSHLK